MMLIPEQILGRLLNIVQCLTVVLIVANLINIVIKWSVVS